MTAYAKFAVPAGTMSFSRALSGHRDGQYRILTEGPRPKLKIHNSSCKDPSVNINMSRVRLSYERNLQSIVTRWKIHSYLKQNVHVYLAALCYADQLSL